MTVDPTKIHFAAPEYPIDKIVGFYEGSFNIAAAGIDGFGFDVASTATVTIIHGLDYIPLTDMIWSIDNINFYPSGTELITDYGAALFDDTYDSLIAIERVGATTVIILGESIDNAARTIYYKLWLIHPE